MMTADELTDERMDHALLALASSDATGATDVKVPALPAALEVELESLQPVKSRAPAKQMAIFVITSLAVTGLLVGALSLRRDLSLLPRGWLIVYVGAWLSSFLALAYLALVPSPGAVSPRWRTVGGGALVIGALFVLGGLLFARSVPGLSFESPGGASALLRHGHACLRWGLITAIAPVVMGALFLRGAVPSGARWVSAGLGAAGGALGGLMLHLHCHIADAMHLGLIHGGVVVLGALLAAFSVSRLMRP